MENQQEKIQEPIVDTIPIEVVNKNAPYMLTSHGDSVFIDEKSLERGMTQTTNHAFMQEIYIREMVLTHQSYMSYRKKIKLLWMPLK